MSKGTELKDDVLDKSVYGGVLKIKNGGWFHNAEVIDENKRCLVINAYGKQYEELCEAVL